MGGGDVALRTAPLILNGLSFGAEHFDTVWEPAKYRYQKARGRVPAVEDEVYPAALLDRRTMEDRGYVLRRRRDVAPDEEIVATVRHRGEQLPRRPGDSRSTYEKHRRASSVSDLRRAGVGGAAAGAGAGAGALVAYRGRGRDGGEDGDNASDSEGSIPPRSRVRAKSTSSRSKTSRYRERRSSSTSSISSTSTSSLGSSGDEEKQIRKMKRKKWITAALASVATIHAAQKVYSSIENHDRRIREVERGTLSPQEAAKKQRSARWQDAAAVGVAALGVHGAISEWKEVSEEHAHHLELMQEKEEHHKRRVEHERRKRARQQNGYYQGRDGKWYYDGPDRQFVSSSTSYRSSNRYDDRPVSEDGGRQRLKAIEYKQRSRSKKDDYDDDSNEDDDDDDDYDKNRSRRRDRRRARSRARSARDRSRSRS